MRRMLLDNFEHGKGVGVTVQEACGLFGADRLQTKALEAPDL